MKKVVIITGANRGLGKALADLVLTRDDTFIISVSRSIAENHVGFVDERFKFIKTDLADPFPSTMIPEIKNHISEKSIIYFFNNAGSIAPLNKIGDFNAADIVNSININVSFPVLFTNFLISEFKDIPIKIINITSGAATKAIECWSLYSAAKSYMNVFFATLTKENDFKVYNIDPGVLDTTMQEMIRAQETPSQGYFLSLKREDKLTDPHVAAERILNKIDF